jgi:hypothetical protein
MTTCAPTFRCTDFRDYADVGGGREALVAPGGKLATTDLEIAQLLAGRHLQELDAMRRGSSSTGRPWSG